MRSLTRKISVIVIMYNAARTIDNCIKSLLNQTYGNYEIIVVDDCSTDGSRNLAKKFPIKLFQTKKNSGVGATRNLGLKHAKGEIVAFTDSDCVVSDDWLMKINDTFRRFPSVGAVGGSVINHTKSLLGYADYFLNYSEHIPKGKIQERRTIPTMNIAYNKGAVGNLLFPNIRNSEDSIFNHEFAKNGHKIIFNPDIQVKHFPEIPDLKTFLKKQKIYAEGIAYTRMKYDLPGRVLIKYKPLLLLFPRLILISKRVIISKFFFKYLQSLPYIFLGELEFIKTIFKYDPKENLLKQ